MDFLDDAESSSSSSAVKDWNEVREFAGSKGAKKAERETQYFLV